MSPEQIIEEVKVRRCVAAEAPGFPTGLKWSFVPRTSPKPKYIIVNADESEPGTCKDRLLMENDPHQLIEGILIAGRAVDAHKGYIYIRGEYRYLIEAMDRAIAEAYERGYLGKNIQGTGFDFDIYTHTGAGAYECGEETALLDSIEGKRGIPRMKPPFPAVVGAWQSPTLLNNVETFSAIPAIIRDGGAAFAALGNAEERRHAHDLPFRSHQQTRRVRAAGRLHSAADDLRSRRRHAQWQKAEGGGSGWLFLPASESRRMRHRDGFRLAGESRRACSARAARSFWTKHRMVQFALRIMKFYAHESCGWCIPCREGTTWLKRMLTAFMQAWARRATSR